MDVADIDRQLRALTLRHSRAEQARNDALAALIEADIDRLLDERAQTLADD